MPNCTRGRWSPGRRLATDLPVGALIGYNDRGVADSIRYDCRQCAGIDNDWHSRLCGSPHCRVGSKRSILPSNQTLRRPFRAFLEGTWKRLDRSRGRAADRGSVRVVRPPASRWPALAFGAWTIPGTFYPRPQGQRSPFAGPSNSLLLNWRKRGGSYPSFKKLIGEFEEYLGRFTVFAEREGVGPLAVNQWELTYIDAFPKGEYWSSPADWATFLPGLFGQLFPTEGLGMGLEHRAAQWSYEIQPKRGRLHITAGPGRAEEDKRDAVLLSMTARGPVGKGGQETLRAGLDLGHAVTFGTFLRAVSDEAKKRWETRP
jgi:hypothetical protein